MYDHWIVFYTHRLMYSQSNCHKSCHAKIVLAEKCIGQYTFVCQNCPSWASGGSMKYGLHIDDMCLYLLWFCHPKMSFLTCLGGKNMYISIMVPL